MRKLPSCRGKERRDYEVAPFFHSLPDCPRDFYVSQGDQHSDLTACLDKQSYGNGCCRGFAPQFPDPRAHTFACARQKYDGVFFPCAYSFVDSFVIILYFCAFVNRLRSNFLAENSLGQKSPCAFGEKARGDRLAVKGGEGERLGGGKNVAFARKLQGADGVRHAFKRGDHRR